MFDPKIIDCTSIYQPRTRGGFEIVFVAKVTHPSARNTPIIAGFLRPGNPFVEIKRYTLEGSAKIGGVSDCDIVERVFTGASQALLDSESGSA